MKPTSSESNSTSEARTFDYPAVIATRLPGPGGLARLEASQSDPRWLPADESISVLCREYDAALPEYRNAIRATSIAPNNLDHFAKRMAIRALRTGAVDNIRLGLLALSIEEGKYDFRDSLCSLAMLKHAAAKTDIDFPSIAESISKISSEAFSQLLQSFLMRSAEDSSLAAMGQIETSDQNGTTMKFDLDRTLEHVKKLKEARSGRVSESKLRGLFGFFFGSRS